MASNYVAQKVKMWVDCVRCLSDVAKVQPKATHAAVSISLQFEWSFLQRVTPNCATAFVPLQDAIHHQFYPAVLGGPFSEFKVWLFDLPARAGGLGISDPIWSLHLWPFHLLCKVLLFFGLPSLGRQNFLRLLILMHLIPFVVRSPLLEEIISYPRLMPKRRKSEIIDWLLRLAMLPFCLLLSLWMVPWVKRLLYFRVVSLISFLLPGVKVMVMFLGGLRLILALW